MGYTIGRRLTKEKLQEIALQFNTRGEFLQKDHSAYQTALRAGLLDEICSHMAIGSFSIPQLICQKIMEEILQEECLYNIRKIIPPYELDVYFESCNLAIEYHGKGWHSHKDAIERDDKKRKLCLDKGITLIEILERSRNYEEDIKSQLIEKLDLINKTTNKNINKDKILQIDTKSVYQSLLNEDKVKELIKNCKNIAEFQKKYQRIYYKIAKAGRLDLLDPIRERMSKTDEDLKKECSKIEFYSDFVANSPLYQAVKKRGLMKYTRHMKKNYVSWSEKTDEELIEEAKLFKTKIDLRNKASGLRNCLVNRGIYDKATEHMTPLTNRIY